MLPLRSCSTKASLCLTFVISRTMPGPDWPRVTVSQLTHPSSWRCTQSSTFSVVHFSQMGWIDSPSFNKPQVFQKPIDRFHLCWCVQQRVQAKTVSLAILIRTSWTWKCFSDVGIQVKMKDLVVEENKERANVTNGSITDSADKSKKELHEYVDAVRDGMNTVCVEADFPEPMETVSLRFPKRDDFRNPGEEYEALERNPSISSSVCSDNYDDQDFCVMFDAFPVEYTSDNEWWNRPIYLLTDFSLFCFCFVCVTYDQWNC